MATNNRPQGSAAHSRSPLMLAFVVIALTAFLLVGSTCADDGAAAFSMSIDEFRALAPADQNALLASVFEHRLQHAMNIHYEALLLVDFAESDPATQTVGKVLKRLNGSRLRHWVRGKSFRMDTIRGGPDVVNPEQFVASGFDAESGVARSTVHLSDRKQSFGRIDTNPDQIDESNSYARWLDGALAADKDSLPRYLFKYRDEFTIEAPADESMVRLTVPWHFWDEGEPWGTRVFSLDPQKGFFPLHGKSYGRSAKYGKTLWMLDEFFVEESRLVNDVWMPTKLRWVIDSSSAEGCGVEHITVERIEAGTVTQSDLEVPFEPGMEVVDAIQGEAYVVGPDGDRTKVQSLVGAAGSMPPLDRGGNRLIWIGLGNLVVLVAAVFVRQFIKRGGWSGSRS